MPQTLDKKGLAASRNDDSDWVRTSDLYPVNFANCLLYSVFYIHKVKNFYLNLFRLSQKTIYFNFFWF